MKLYVKKLPEKCSGCGMLTRVKGEAIKGFCDDHECRSPECVVVGYKYTTECNLNSNLDVSGERPKGCSLNELPAGIVEFLTELENNNGYQKE